MEMISGNCPHCRSSIEVGYVPVDVKLFCQSCGKSLSLREAYDFRSYTRLKKRIEQSDSREIKAAGIQLNPTNTAQAIKQKPSKPSKMSDKQLLRELYIEVQQGNKTLKDIYVLLCGVVVISAAITLIAYLLSNS